MYELVDTQAEVEKLRPKKFLITKNYMVRIRPDIKLKDWSLPDRQLVLRRGLSWITLSGKEAGVASLYSENGRLMRSERARSANYRMIRPIADIVETEEDARRVEALYELARQQSMPGTPERPHIFTGNRFSKSQSPVLDRILDENQVLFADDVPAEPPAPLPPIVADTPNGSGIQPPTSTAKVPGPPRGKAKSAKPQKPDQSDDSK